MSALQSRGGVTESLFLTGVDDPVLFRDGGSHCISFHGTSLIRPEGSMDG